MKRSIFVRLTMMSGVFAIAAPAAGGGPWAYRLEIIEPWNTTYSLASSGVADINNLNQVSGCATTEPLGGPCSFLWTLEDGKSPISLAGQINDLGVIVATDTIRWPDGTIEPLGGEIHGVGDINNSNLVVGSTGTVHSCHNPLGADAAVWDRDAGTMLLDRDYGVQYADEAWAVNNVGEVVGVRTITGHCGTHKAFYFDLNTLEHIDIHTALVGGLSGKTEVYDINDGGVVVGEGPFGGTVRPFLWQRDSGFTFLPALPGALLMNTHFGSINNDGRAVGGAILDGEWRAIVWDETNGVRDLNDLAETPPGFVIDSATEINDNGLIIGRGHYGVWSPERAVVLIPLSQVNVGDLSGDGVVDGADLATLLGQWGQGGSAADLNNDGTVDGADLAMLLGLWS